MSRQNLDRHRKRLKMWLAATAVQAALLVVGLAVTEYVDADLSDPGFTVVLYLSVLVLLPLMATTLLSAIVTVIVAVRYHRVRRRS